MNAISLTRELIRIPSESSDPIRPGGMGPEEGVRALLQSLCHQARISTESMEVSPGRHNFVARFPAPGLPRLLLAAHMDTVSARGMEEPFSGNFSDNRLWGRGACDDKGPLAVALATLLDLTQAGKKLAFDVTFAGTVDEECSMAGAVRLAADLEPWDLCIGLEPTSLRIVKAHKGVYRFQVTTRGKAAHSSTPEKGENAILAMLPILADIREYGSLLAQESDLELGSATLAITQLHGGSSVNIIPDECTMGVDIRLLPGMAPEVIKKEILELVAKRGAVTEIFQGQPLHTSMENRLVKAFQAAVSAAGSSPKPVTAAYATDCAKMNHKGPCIIWGPGDINQAHQLTEFIDIEQISKAQEILELFLTGLS